MFWGPYIWLLAVILLLGYLVFLRKWNEEDPVRPVKPSMDKTGSSAARSPTCILTWGSHRSDPRTVRWLLRGMATFANLGGSWST